MTAIQTLKALESENRAATDAEKQLLVRYVGWGGLPQLFAPAPPEEWRIQSHELSSLLTTEEWEAARASTLSAHYTSPAIIEAIYEAAQHLGFEDGRILEPAAGIGHFFGLMPRSMSAKSELTGIEIDSLSARIAQQLYPDVQFHHRPFEETNLPDSGFDLIISNVPFGNYQPYDPHLSGFLIHDYFFAKSLEKVRPEGLLIFITSRGTLDKENASVRRYLADRAEFLGAIRLPNTAFQRNANTQVTTDIVFLRRDASNGRPWVNLAEHRNPEGIPFKINEYFAANPHMMLGTMDQVSGLYSNSEPVLAPDGRDLGAAIREVIQFLPKKVYSHSLKIADTTIPAPAHVKDMAYALHDGNVMVRQGNALIPLEPLSPDRRRRIKAFITLRDSVRDTLRTQLDGSSEEDVSTARRTLNLHYDHFVSRFGPINANVRAFEDDPDLPLLCSLESFDKETGKASKNAVFRERTIHPRQNPNQAETPRDALVLSLNEHGAINLPYMESLLGKSPEQFLPELAGLVYHNPVSGRWEPEDLYLSGNVRQKLVEAKNATASNPAYLDNIKALEAVQPPDLTYTEIEARLGSSWIPPADIEAFVYDLLGSSASVSHSSIIGTWSVKSSGGYSVRNTTEWGTAHYPAIDLINDALNLKLPSVYNYDSKTGQRTLDIQKTEAARDKFQKVKERFQSWVWQNEERRDRLCTLYNREFNSIRLRSFNGEHLILPGSSQQISLRPHQKNAIWRIVQTPNTLLAHTVGAGKTYAMVAAAMELKRLGLAHKAMFVVPNHMLGQFSNELLSLYPTANILVAGKADFEKTRRQLLFSRISTGNWDAVIVTHASFERIPVSLDRRKEFIKSQVAELEAAIRERKKEEGTKLVKDLERAKRQLENKLHHLAGEDRKDNTLTFEELGVDRLFVDEAHKFKNLFYTTKMTRVAGLPMTASERAYDMFLKVQYIQSRNNGGGVVFATGTPISNTMAEMFTMQRYLQLGALRAHGLSHFDSWAGTFGEVVTTMELNPDGSGYRMQNRFAQFVNVPELIQLFREVADVQTAEMLKLPVPKIENGGPVTVCAKATPELKTFVGELVKRAERIKSGSVKPHQDNMLNLTSEGRKAALDMRLVKPRLRDHPESKVNQAVERIFAIWQSTAADRKTQMVFCDLSTPNPSRFSVYQDVQAKLVARGVPPQETAFIQDCPDDESKMALFKAVREGAVRILFGSTAKMGEGTNVQKRLVALHHLDPPWRPSDIEQREGRILRQGNDNERVSIFRYVTEGSFDAYMWQTLESKSRFIAQIMTGDAAVRKAEDIDAAALTYAEVKAIASGNPMVIEKATIDAEVIRLSRLKRQHAETQHHSAYTLANYRQTAQHYEQEIEALKKDIAALQKTTDKPFGMTIGEVHYTKRTEAGQRLIDVGQSLRPMKNANRCGQICGFPFSVERRDLNTTVRIHGIQDYTAKLSASPVGTIVSIEHALADVPKRLIDCEEARANALRNAAELEKHRLKPFEYEQKLERMLLRQKEILEALDLSKNQAPVAAESVSLPANSVGVRQSQKVSLRVK